MNSVTPQLHCKLPKTNKNSTSIIQNKQQQKIIDKELFVIYKILHAKRVVVTLASKSIDWARWRGCIWARTSGSAIDRKEIRWVWTCSTLSNVVFTESITFSGTTAKSRTPPSIFDPNFKLRLYQGHKEIAKIQDSNS